MNDAKHTDEFLDGLLDKDAFARHVMGVVRDTIGGPEPSYAPDKFQVRLPNGGDFYLGNVHREYALMDREGRADWLSKFPQFVAELAHFDFKDVPSRYDDAANRLYPVIASRADMETERLARIAPSSEPFDLVSEHVGVRLVIDMPNSFMRVQAGLLQGWGVAFGEALDAAKRNLRATNRRLWRKARRGLYVAEASWDDYTASALLLPDLFAGLDVKGDLVVLAPLRDRLMATGSRDTDGLKQMASLSLSLIDRPRLIWPTPMLLKGGKWLPFIPDRVPDGRAVFELLKWSVLERDYDRQTAALRQGTSRAFAALLFLTEDKSTGECRSVTTWTKQSSPVLLPKADLVELVGLNVLTGQPARPVVLVRWDSLASVLGSRLQKMPQYFPARYLAVDFPSDAEMVRLPEEAVYG